MTLCWTFESALVDADMALNVLVDADMALLAHSLTCCRWTVPATFCSCS